MGRKEKHILDKLEETEKKEEEELKGFKIIKGDYKDENELSNKELRNAYKQLLLEHEIVTQNMNALLKNGAYRCFQHFHDNSYRWLMIPLPYDILAENHEDGEPTTLPDEIHNEYIKVLQFYILNHCGELFDKAVTEYKQLQEEYYREKNEKKQI